MAYLPPATGRTRLPTRRNSALASVGSEPRHPMLRLRSIASGVGIGTRTEPRLPQQQASKQSLQPPAGPKARGARHISRPGDCDLSVEIGSSSTAVCRFSDEGMDEASPVVRVPSGKALGGRSLGGWALTTSRRRGSDEPSEPSAPARPRCGATAGGAPPVLASPGKGALGRVARCANGAGFRLHARGGDEAGDAGLPSTTSFTNSFARIKRFVQESVDTAGADLFDEELRTSSVELACEGIPGGGQSAESVWGGSSSTSEAFGLAGRSSVDERSREDDGPRPNDVGPRPTAGGACAYEVPYAPHATSARPQAVGTPHASDEPSESSRSSRPDDGPSTPQRGFAFPRRSTSCSVSSQPAIRTEASPTPSACSSGSTDCSPSVSTKTEHELSGPRPSTSARRAPSFSGDV